MHIKSLTIHGFKSFRDTVTIDAWSPGHNVVVGRNGSGKSNFFAAIRFVLGDAYTSLSREERQALLYDGASATSTTTSAYVEMIFDNRDARFPAQGDDVVLRRTLSLTRDEYMIDRKAATKQDVTQLLESAGFSTSPAYYIIPQGRLTHMAHATDAERLDWLKDVAGTRVYEQRRAESMEILRSTELRYEASTALLAQLATRMDELSAEQSELQKFHALDKTRRCLEYTIYQRELADISDMLETLENERRREVDASHTRQAAYTRQAHEVAAMEAQARALEEQLEQLAWDQAQLEQERRALTRSQAHLDNTRDDVAMAMDGQGPEALTEQLAALDAEVLAREQALATKTQEHTHAAATLEAQRTAYEDTRARLAALYAKQGRAAHYDTVEARDEAIQAELDEVARQLAQQDTAMATAKAQWEAAQAQHAEHAAHMRDVEQTYAQRTQAYHDAQAAWDTRHAARAKYVEEKNEQWNADAKRTTQLTQARDELSQAQRALAATMDRATAAGLQAVERIAAAEHLDGVLGPLYQLFHVDERYRLAVEATAGAALFHVVVDTDTTATRLLQRLQQEKSGRVTFMPLNRLRPVDTPMPQAPDAVVLLRKLTFDDALLPAMKQVFGKTIVCPRLEIAAAYVRSHRGLNAITLDGDQVDRRGALSGGYHDPSRSRLDAVQRVQQALTRVDTLASEQAAARQALATLEQTLTAVYSEMIALEAQKAQAQDARTQAQNELTYLRRTEADAAARVARCERACTEATLARQTLSTRQAALQAELGTPLLHHLSQEEQADVQRLTAQTRAQQSALATQTRTTVALAEQLATLQSELDEHWRRSRASVQDRLERARPAPSAEAAAALAQSRATNADRLAHLQAQQDTLSATYARLQADLATARASHEHEADVTQQQAAAERWAARKQRMLEQRARCHERIRDLGALPDDAFQTYQRQTTEALVTQLQTTRTSLDALSHVNKRAVEQLDSFTQQRTALLQRHADLQASQASIHELIDVLDQRKDAALTSTYEQVAMHFRTIFAQLVPTGQGTLQRHEHGVSLQVTFHTQQTQMRMAQLSGGQKSLVALALVCAMQKTDPAPFYLWDEIDANLDTQYRTAVANLVHALAADAQFITTTFRPELVERADRHFGVVFRPDKTSTVLDISRADAQDFVEAADT